MMKCLHAVFLGLFLSLSIQGQTVIAIDDFSASADDLELLGEAAIVEDFLRLTPTSATSRGATWFKTERIDLSRGFETEFVFRVINPAEGAGFGDGFAFVVQNQGAQAIGEVGEGIGYAGIKDGVVIEFDTYNNGEGSTNHIDIAYYIDGQTTYKRYATVHAIPEITDGKEHFARVHYKDGFFTLFMDSYIFPVLSSKLDIIDIIGTQDSMAYVGFTAATSEAAACHDLMTWTMNYYLAPPEDVDEEEVEVAVAAEVPVSSRKVKVYVKDYNKVDGDVMSLKYGEHWVLTEHRLTAEPKEIDLTLTGFSTDLIMFANDVGRIPPNTAAIIIDDGVKRQVVKLKADYQTSEAIRLFYQEPAATDSTSTSVDQGGE